MATSGSLTTTKYDGRYYKLEWERTATSLTNNTSTIKWTLSCAGGDSWYAERTLEVVIAGVTVKSKTSRVERKAGTIDSGTLTIKHNTDGTKNFTASVKVAVYTSTVNCTGSKAFSLTEIPRVSTITATSAYLGGSCTITISRKVSSYTHTLKYQFGDLTGTIVSKTSSTNYKWNIPSSFANQMSTVASKNGALICDTYSGSTLIGTKTCPFTVKVGSSNYPKAEIEVWTTDDLSLRLIGHDAGVILGVSEMAYEVTASTGTGATIKSYAVTNGTVKKTTKTGTFTNATSDDFTAVVTDSRGLTKETNVQFGDVVKYIPLTNSLSAKMTADGVINFTTSGKYFKGSFGAVTNTLKVQYRYKVSGGTYTSWTNMDVSGAKATASYNLSGSITGLDYTKVYYFQTRAIDEVKTVTASAKKLNAFPIFDWGEEDFNVNVELRIKDVNIFELIYPVGSIYMSVNNTNPANLFGGTWVRWGNGRVPVGVNADNKNFNTVEKTGGSATHTLTVDEIPSHSHRLYSRAVYSGTGNHIAHCNQDNGSDSYAYTTGSTGGGKAHNNLQPYITCYMWKRTA